ncbi:MAG: peptidoglycan DD-metalloendopeptidase family protein [Bacteroidales bacterium]
MEKTKQILRALSYIGIGLVIGIIGTYFLMSHPNENKDNQDNKDNKIITESIVKAKVNKADANILTSEIHFDKYNMPDTLLFKKGVVKRNQFFANLLSDLGVSQKEIYNLTNICKDKFDLKHFQVGKHYKAYFTEQAPEELAYLAYEKDSRSYVVFTLKDSLAVKNGNKAIDYQYHYQEVVIKNSLWYDVTEAGITPLLAITLADIYAWTIDFFGLQPGDSFKAYYQTVSIDGKIVDIEKVLYSEFTHKKDAYTSYYFDEKAGNYEGTNGDYWNEKGESMKKAFLKAPLNFNRISSKFTLHRRHPITRIVRPHTGVDYAAPIGTPVRSIGDGKIIGRYYQKRGGGNIVKIRHNSVYTTAYQHLSKYAKGIHVGAYVKQGQIIGYVGTTGMSTGPHLDFRVWKNGTPTNPLTMKSPPTKPIAKDQMQAFKTSINKIDSKIYYQKALEYLEESGKLLEGNTIKK